FFSSLHFSFSLSSSLWIPPTTSSPPARFLHRPLPISSSSMLFSRLSYRSLFTIHRPLIQQPLLNTVCCRCVAP
ncbi:hypothetical protein VIGAN_01074700, partial [Vigna angularis var. angularis]